MKGLSIEEKAKAYDEMLVKAKELKEANPSDEGIQKWVEDAFPELIESKDEKARKALIKFFSTTAPGSQTCGVDDRDIIAWLEKQKEIDKTSYEIAEKEKQEFVGDGFIKCYADFQDFKEGKTYQLEYVGNDDYIVKDYNLLGKTYHITPCQLYTIFKKLTWIDKQAESYDGNFPTKIIISQDRETGTVNDYWVLQDLTDNIKKEYIRLDKVYDLLKHLKD